jgi:MFS family permease
LCILPIAGVLAAGALTSSWIVRAIGTKFTAATGLLLVSGGLVQIAIIASVTTTYAEVLPGMLLMGLGAGLLMPSATDSVLGTLTRDDTGVGSATNSTAMQVGGALGVAVIGSVLSTRYQHTLEPALAGRHVPPVAAQAILGSLGGASGGGPHCRRVAWRRPLLTSPELASLSGATARSWLQRV